MGDTNRPPGVADSVVPIPVPKAPRVSGDQPVQPESSGEISLGALQCLEKLSGVIATIEGIGHEVANEVEETAQVPDVIIPDNVRPLKNSAVSTDPNPGGQLIDFAKLRKKGLASSHEKSGNKRKRAGNKSTQPGPAKTRTPRPKPPKVDGLTPLPSPAVVTITGGKRTVESQASLEHSKEYTERRGTTRLFNVVGLIKDELADKDMGAPGESDYVRTARSLMALLDEDFSDEKRETDNKFFMEVAKILLHFWPRNYFERLNDRRVTDMMKLIQGQGPHARIVGILKAWNTSPAGRS